MNHELEKLHGLRVAVIATDGFEESELTEPVDALKKAGAEVTIISTHDGKIRGARHHGKGAKVRVDRTLDDVKPDEYDALELPGGALNADELRRNEKVQSFVKSFDAQKKPIAAICHAPWILVSSGLVKGRRLTSFHTIQDDIRNAGGEWIDSEVVEEGNLVTSRQPSDIPSFNRAMLELFGRTERRRVAA